jgi:hypothetical protein
MMLFTKEIDKKLAAQYHLGADLNAQVVVAKIFNPYGNGRWYLINSDPSDPDYLWAIVQIGDIVEVGSVSRKELENLRVGRLRFPLERDLGFSQRNAQEVYNGVVMGKTYAKGGMADVTPTYKAGGEISPETLTKFAEDLQQAESEAYDNLDIRSGGQLYRTPSLQKQYASAMNQAFAELTKKHAHLKDINVENGQTIYDMLEDQNYHSLNNYLALRGVFGTKYKQKYEGYHTKYPDNYLDPANMGGAQSYAVGGLTPGRFYVDNEGVEYKFIGKIDNGPNKDQLLFTDGTKKAYKTLDEFGGKPKENKLFGFFDHGGEIFKYVQNTFKDENGVVHIDAYTTSEDDDDENYDEDEGTIVAYVFPDGRVAYLNARAKYDKNVQKVIKESGGNDVIEDLFEIPEYLPEEVKDVLDKYNEGLEEGDYEALKKAKKELESIGFTFDYDLGGGAFDLQVVDDLDSMSYMADGGNTSDFDKLIADKFKMNDEIDYANDLKDFILEKYKGKSVVGFKLTDEAYDGNTPWVWKLKNKNIDVFAEPFGDSYDEGVTIAAYENEDEPIGINHYEEFKLTGDFEKDAEKYLKLIRPYLQKYGSGKKPKVEPVTIDVEAVKKRENDIALSEQIADIVDGYYWSIYKVGNAFEFDFQKLLQEVKAKKIKGADLKNLGTRKGTIEWKNEVLSKFGNIMSEKEREKLEKHDGRSVYADGGKVKFADKVKSIQASLLKRKKVAPSVQKDYGKTYNKAEAKQAATRITGAMTAKERLMAKKKK